MIKYVKALTVAFKAHKGQKDKAGVSYIWHPIRVSLRVKGYHAKVVALLHDVIEDTQVSLEDLTFLEDRHREALSLLTHHSSVDYMEYVRRLKENSIARAVKISDLKDNRNLDRLKKITPKDLERVEKYMKALEILEGDS